MNIISIALDFDQLEFARMMFEEEYVNDMAYVDTPDKMGKTALDRACERNIYDIAHYIWPRFAGLVTETGINKLLEQAIDNGFTDIADMLSRVKRPLAIEIPT